MTILKRAHEKILNPTLILVGLGYFIDSFDLMLFNALRVPSLQDLGLTGDDLTRAGIHILNLQVLGMLIGGFVWGVSGDKVGRKKALIGSVLLYSLGSLGCALVHEASLYALMRFITGIGLAGEFGLGAILTVETLPDAKRNWALGLFAVFSVVAIFAANLLPEFLSWRPCYTVGGVAGLLLLLARTFICESSLFEDLVHSKIKRGALVLFWQKPDLFKRWISCVLLIMPQVFTTGFLMTFAPEISQAVGVTSPVKANIALMVYFSCALVANALVVFMCNWVHRRIPVTLAYLSLASIAVARYLTLDHPSAGAFYVCCGVLGLVGFYMLYLFMTVEQFGTNMRATMATSALSSGRATLILTNLIYLALHNSGFNVLSSTAMVSAFAFGAGFLSLLGLRETYTQSMDFLEEPLRSKSRS